MNRQLTLHRRVVLSALQCTRNAATAPRSSPVATLSGTNLSLHTTVRQFHATRITRISNDMLLSVSMNVSQKAATSQKELVEQLRDNNSVRSARVFEAMCQVDRAFYARVPTKVASAAGAAAAAATNPYAHAPTAIGQCSTISSPYSHAIALETLEATGLLNPTKQPRVLDVGSGSGYLTACLAHLIHDPSTKEQNAQVVALEHSSVLLEQSKQNIAEDPKSATLFKVKSLFEFVQGDANDEDMKWNVNGDELFDVIHVGAAFPKIPVHLVKLLREGGVLLSPVCLSSHNTKGEQELLLITKDEKVQVGFTTKKIMSCSYAPIAKEAPAVDVDEVSSVVRDLKALEEQIQAKKDALQQWQNEFKDKNGRKPSVTEMKADAVMSKLMNEVSPLLNKKKAMERIIAQANAQ